MPIAFGTILVLLSVFGFLREGFRISTLLVLLAAVLAIVWGSLPKASRFRLALPAAVAAVLLVLPFACPAPSRVAEREWNALGRTVEVDRYLTLSETVRAHLSTYPGDIRAIGALAAGAENVGRTDEAFSYRLSALAAGEDRPEAWLRAVDDARASGNLPALAPLLTARVAAHPDDPDANRQLGDAEAASGRLMDAMYHWSVAARENPQDAQAHLSLAGGFLSLGSLDACDTSLQAAFETATEPALLSEIRAMQDQLLEQTALMRGVAQ